MTNVENETPLTVVKNVCPLDCPDTCSMLVTVKDGVAVELRGDPDHPLHARVPLPEDGPVPRAGLQPRSLAPADEAGRAARARAGSSRSPGTRRSTTIAERFAAIAALGRRAAGDPAVQLLRHDGQAPVEQPRPAVLPPAGGLEARPDDLCVGRRRWATNTRWAAAGWGPTRWPCPKCKFIVNWGSNTVNTNSHLWSLMIEARKAGATIVTVDPYRSPTARRSDWHIQPRPGTDAALALGLMHVIWRDGLQDDDYLDRGHGRRRAAATARPGRVSARDGRGDHRASTSATIDDASPIAWPASSRR